MERSEQIKEAAREAYKNGLTVNSVHEKTEKSQK
jgi:hypothetical protein